jgi:hypothetical protein
MELNEISINRGIPEYCSRLNTTQLRLSAKPFFNLFNFRQLFRAFKLLPVTIKPIYSSMVTLSRREIVAVSTWDCYMAVSFAPYMGRLAK